MSKAKATTNKSAAIYVRVSGEYDERTASLDSQERECRKLIEENGYTVDHVLVERYTGKSLHQRKELSKLREMIANGEIQCVAFYDIDRFTRGGSGHIWILLGECRDKGVKLLCVTQDLSDTFENNVVITVKAEAARKELESIRERTLRGRKEKLRKGILPGQGGDMIGYRINRETWKREIHEEEAQIIRRIFEEAASGKSYRQITLDLQAEGVPSPGELLKRNYKTPKIPRWHRTTVTAIITNPAYVGTTLAQVWVKDESGKKRRNDPANFVELHDVTPPIVSRELWERANETRKQALLFASSTRNQKNFILLRGLVFCKRCHRKMRPKQARNFWSFRCASKTDESLGESCGAPTVSIEWLTNRVWDRLCVELTKPDALRQMVGDLSNQGEQKERLLKDHERLEKRIEEIEKSTERLTKLVSRSDDDIVMELYEREIKILADQRRGIDETLLQIELSIREVEASMPHVPTLVELQNAFLRGEHGWTDQDKRDHLIHSGLRIYVDGRDFDIRMITGKVVAEFRETDALVAYESEVSGTNYIPHWP